MIGRTVTLAAAVMLVASSAWAGSMCPRQTQAMAVVASETPPAETTIVTEATADEAVVAAEAATVETSN